MEAGNRSMDGDGSVAEQAAASDDLDAADTFEPDAVGPAVDLLAGLAGGRRSLELADMQLRDRGAGWQGEPLTGESLQHVPVWETPKAPTQTRKASPLR